MSSIRPRMPCEIERVAAWLLVGCRGDVGMARLVASALVPAQLRGPRSPERDDYLRALLRALEGPPEALPLLGDADVQAARERAREVMWGPPVGGAKKSRYSGNI